MVDYYIKSLICHEGTKTQKITEQYADNFQEI